MKIERTNKDAPAKVGGRALVIEARFYQEIADQMFVGAARVLEAAGMAVERIDVPGALEIPAALQMAALSGRYDAFVVTGCVIRGETYHFEIVCGESAHGISSVTLAHELCVGNAVLTVNTIEQAAERADPDRLDKGGDAARAAVRMLEVKKAFVA
ncbi:MAG: 6,7-dimethyl-8-ribityllumazine synthase [Rhodospirillales bacterium]|nr:6,7-dimethyl-8-ribityllumazine synthase [Alphaproteobacteria bacterium]MCB9987168.1 6,7-dimethyl-8-ribityllumazine synthase [Rhodospirillales bacterium]USO07968.1 MAG: 6,7-dimethyl-8-ribityllumazine synthase [Rhodospirillales bacterium]